MDLDPTNPNLDGDYKTFLNIEAQRQAKGDDIESIITRDTILDVTDCRPETTTSDVALSLTDVKGSDVQDLRNSLFQYTKHGDVEKCNNLVKLLATYEGNLTLTHPTLREKLEKTVLHYALELNQKKVAKFYMDLKDYDLLAASFTVKTEKGESSKTCLHLLVGMDDLKLLEHYLQILDEYPKKEEFMKKTTLTIIPGQRPRDLPAIHLAALGGKTDTIRLIHKYHSDSMNMPNIKKDTPILWAARWNHIDTANTLLQLGAKPNVANDKGSTALYWAVRYGYPEMTSELINSAKNAPERDALVNYRRRLGFEIPLILAGALGHVDIIKILLENGANTDLKRAGGSTALHIAAMIGRVKVIDVLLDYGANKEVEDDLGNTPLLIAIKNNHLGVAKELIANGANFNTANKLGESIWDMAIDSPNNDMLITILSLFKQWQSRGRKLSRVNTVSFTEGRSPLHVAATKGDVAKIKMILSLGVSADLRDQHGNTFLHIAARDNNMGVLKEFMDCPGVDINSQSSQGDTAMHLAAHEGHHMVVASLLTKSSLNIRNNMKETVLHTGVRSPRSTPEIVEMLVDAIVKTQSWDVIDAVDEHGNTALHVAARTGRCEILQTLTHLNPKLLNKDGESPLHIAAALGDEEVMRTILTLFSNPEKGFNIDMPRCDGETMLHICAKNGNDTLVNLLIKSGASLATRDESGNTVLHDLVLQIVNTPTQTAALINVFEMILDNAAWWWCTSHLEYPPDEGSDLYISKSQQAIRYLLEGIPNFTGYGVIQYATALGASNVLKFVFSSENIYTFTGRESCKFDVTYLSPETLYDQRNKPKKKTSRIRLSQSSVSPGKMSEENSNGTKEEKVLETSCLDIVVGMTDEVVATSVLDVHPINYLITDYWTAYRFIYLTLMVVHLINMGAFSAYSIPLARQAWKQNGTNSDYDVNGAYGCLLIWPSMILFFGVVYIVSGAILHCMGPKQNNKPVFHDSPTGLFDFLYIAFEAIMSYISMITAFVYGILSIVWFGLYYNKDRDQVYVLAAALVFGWLYSIYFTKGFQTVHAFSIMLKYIIIRDITRFLFIYSFVLLGFAFAMHALFQISAPMIESSPTGWHSIFTTFNMMIGMDEIFDEDTDSNYEMVKSTSVYLRVTYLFYIILSTVVLLNLLIAMMSDTYNEIKQREGTTWRIGSIRMAIRIERSLPLLAKFLRILRNCQSSFPIEYDDKENRFFITIPTNKLQHHVSVVDSETKQAMTKLESRINLMTNQFVELTAKIDDILEASKVVEIDKQQPGRPVTARPRRRKLGRHKMSVL